MSLMVSVSEEHSPFWYFFIRLCGIIEGIFSRTAILHGIRRFTVELIDCHFRLRSFMPVHSVPIEDGHKTTTISFTR